MKKNIIIAIILIAVLICIGFFIYKTNNKNKTTKSNSTATTSAAKTNEIRHVSMDDIVKIMNENKNYVIVDVRTPDQYKEGHIKDAINLPLETIEKDIASKVPKKDTKIVLYCNTGNRSGQAFEKLKKLGYTNVSNAQGVKQYKYDLVK